MRDEDQTLLIILLGAWILSKYKFEIVPALEQKGSKLYDTLHDDAGHKQDLPANEVPEQLTVLSLAEARQHLNAALTHALGRTPTNHEAAMLYAHSDFENLEVTAGHPWYRLRGNTQKFRSYVSPSEGATGMVFLIKSRYPVAWGLLDSDDPAAYAAALKARGYYTAPLPTYTSGLATRYKVHRA